MSKFEVNFEIKNIVSFITSWFEDNGRGCNAIIGLSGGKDSTIAAALCVKALGRDRVIGVAMPNVEMPDLDDAKRVAEHLQIKLYTVPITMQAADTVYELRKSHISPSTQAMVNLPARLRMATLYAVSQSMNGRVVNTCNLSEDWVGYSTRYGDSAGDFCPLARYTATEVCKIGHGLGLPVDLVDKVPSDGLCGKTDEDNLGFSYAVLDQYIRTGQCEDRNIQEKIDSLHYRNAFKMHMPPACSNMLPLYKEGRLCYEP